MGLGSFLQGAEEEEGRCEAGHAACGKEAPVPALWPCQRPAGEAEVGARVGADGVEGATRAAVHRGARAGVPGGAAAARAAPGAGPGPRPGGEHVRRPGVVWGLLGPPPARLALPGPGGYPLTCRAAAAGPGARGVASAAAWAGARTQLDEAVARAGARRRGRSARARGEGAVSGGRGERTKPASRRSATGSGSVQNASGRPNALKGQHGARASRLKALIPEFGWCRPS